MPCRLLALTTDAHDPGRVADFWAGVLGRRVVHDARGALLPGSDTQVGLRFVPSTVAKSGRNRVHLHLTSTSLADQQRTVAAARALGAQYLDVGQLPEEGHVVLADPEGNELCVIEPGNRFLAGCGPLAELACEGTRDVGLFWASALDWPLVWDQDGETAVQSPHGGTKIAWGGPPVAPQPAVPRQRLHLAVVDGVADGGARDGGVVDGGARDGGLRAEVDRLTALGATRQPGTDDGRVVLADPDGNELWLTGR